MSALNLPVLAFPDAEHFRKWLSRSFDSSPGIWLRIFKKDSQTKTVTYAEAVEEALCYGWIDGLKKSYDSRSWIQRFTPRKNKSIWSQKNTLTVEKLIREKRMRPAGMRAVDSAKQDGRWAKAYPSQSQMQLPPDFIQALKKDPVAQAQFQKLKRAEVYSIFFKLHEAKTESTRKRRMELILKNLRTSHRSLR